jgi:hypothetical protein
VAPFAGFVAPEVLPEVIVKMPSPGALDDIDERLWVPQTADVSFRPLLLNVSSGYYVNLLRVRGAGVLSRHRHPGAVHGWVLKGGGAGRGGGARGGGAGGGGGPGGTGNRHSHHSLCIPSSRPVFSFHSPPATPPLNFTTTSTSSE